MQEFNIGDRVVRFRDPYGVGKVGVVGTVAEVGYGGKNIKLTYDGETGKLKHAEAL